jgi:hypothetical protein
MVQLQSGAAATRRCCCYKTVQLLQDGAANTKRCCYYKTLLLLRNVAATTRRCCYYKPVLLLRRRCCYCKMVLLLVFRVRIQHFRLNTDLQHKKNKKFVGSKTTVYLFLGLHKGRQSYRRRIQLSTENIQKSKHEIS